MFLIVRACGMWVWCGLSFICDWTFCLSPAFWIPLLYFTTTLLWFFPKCCCCLFFSKVCCSKVVDPTPKAIFIILYFCLFLRSCVRLFLMICWWFFMLWRFWVLVVRGFCCGELVSPPNSNSHHHIVQNFGLLPVPNAFYNLTRVFISGCSCVVKFSRLFPTVLLFVVVNELTIPISWPFSQSVFYLFFYYFFCQTTLSHKSKTDKSKA